MSTPATVEPQQTTNARTTDHPLGCLPRGYRFRDFVIERVLGEGGFGVVYSALDLRLERRVAIKEYMPAALATRDTDFSVHMRSSAKQRFAFEAGLRSFVNEAKLLARFDHPALIKVHQFWQEKGTAYMVMPFYAAPTLASWLRSQSARPAEEWVVKFLFNVMDALEALHRANCLHRDVAPDNIMVLENDAPLLLDFGAARQVIGGLTQALTVILKPGYAPLEQYADTVSMKQGPWTDVYALCAVAYSIITGRAPAPAVSRVIADELVPLTKAANGKYSTELLYALDMGLAVKPPQRPQSIAELRALFAPVVAAANAAPPTLAPLTHVSAVPSARAPLEAIASSDECTVAMTAAGATMAAPAVPMGVTLKIELAQHVAASLQWLKRFDVPALRAAIGIAAATATTYGVAVTAGLWIQGELEPRRTPVVVVSEAAKVEPVDVEVIERPLIAPPMQTVVADDSAVTNPPPATTPAPPPRASAAVKPRVEPVAAAKPAPARPAAAPAKVVAPKVAAQNVAAPAPAAAPTLVPIAEASAPTTSRSVALVETARAPEPVVAVAAPPAPAAPLPKPPVLRALQRSQPVFPGEAARSGIHEGRVVAHYSVNTDGSIGQIDIVESQPARVFDREVRRALKSWRYEPISQPQLASVEFAFRMGQ